MAQIKHIALLAKDQLKLAEFYINTFGMKEVFRQQVENSSDIAIYVSDGHINLAILPARGRPEGIYHMGFQVEDLEKTEKVALDNGATQGAKGVPRDGRFAEVFIVDPANTRVDLSTAGWKV